MKLELLKKAAAALREGRSAALTSELFGNGGTLLLDGAVSPEEPPCRCYLSEGKEYFYQELDCKPPLVICGGGHVGYDTARLGDMLDFDVTVMDDRPDFAAPSRFPFAKVRCGEFAQLLDELPRSRNSYFVILTRGHSHDAVCLEEILKLPFAYVGMIGSKRKNALVMEQMRTLGFSEELLSQVHAPIGLPIGSVTPAEIAVSIAAELIQTRSRFPRGIFLGDDVLQSILSGSVVSLAVIVDTQGSTPREAGAVLCVNRDGRVCGTVGGGLAEAETISRAKSLLPGEFFLLECEMGAEKEDNKGMICGGKARILIQTVVNGNE